MLLTVPTKGDFSILYETTQRILLQRYLFPQTRSIKSLLLMRQTTPLPTYNSFLGPLLRSLAETVGLSSPVITKIKSSNRYIVVVPSLTFL